MIDSALNITLFTKAKVIEEGEDYCQVADILNEIEPRFLYQIKDLELAGFYQFT